MELVKESLAIIDVGELQPHPRNPRRGDLDAIRRSINANGFYGAIVAQRSTGFIFAGNHRFQAALAEGARRVPVLWLDVDDEKALRILLADNRTSDLARNDDEQLSALLREILEDSGSLAGTGYQPAGLEKLLASLGDVEPIPAEDQTEELSVQFQVIVTCQSEEEQTELLRRLHADGFECRALVG